MGLGRGFASDSIAEGIPGRLVSIQVARWPFDNVTLLSSVMRVAGARFLFRAELCNERAT